MIKRIKIIAEQLMVYLKKLQTKILVFFFNIAPKSIIRFGKFIVPRNVRDRLRHYYVEGNVESKFFWSKVMRLMRLAWLTFQRDGIIALIRKSFSFIVWVIKRGNRMLGIGQNVERQYALWLKKNILTQEEKKSQRNESIKFTVRPKISIIMPTYDTPKKFLREGIQSVLDQTYENWELCIADDHSKLPHVQEIINEYAMKDSRIKVIVRQHNGHICKASNSALELATGDYVGLLDHDDILWPNALFENVKLINQHRDADFIYSDEDKLNEDGRTHMEPFFKPDWSTDLLRSMNYICHFSVIRRSVLKKVGGFREGYEGAQDWDLFLRITRQTKKIFHIPKVLYSWRISSTSTAQEKTIGTNKDYAIINQSKVLQDDLWARGYRGKLEQTLNGKYWRTVYQIKNEPLVSIIIPTKDKYEYINRCISSILDKTTYKNFELVIVDTGSVGSEIWKLYKRVRKTHRNTQVVEWQGRFNYSEVCNFGAKKSKGEYLLFLNNDTEILTPGWIEAMLEHAQRYEIGAVGCKLLYPDGRIQHIGVILGPGGVAGHALRNFSDADLDSFFVYRMTSDLVRDYSAVTAACLMIARDKFNRVKGFDPIFRIAFNDVDFCLKLGKAGWINIYTPYTVLKHYESVSVGKPESGNRDMKEFIKEVRLMEGKWKDLLDNDPFYNPNLTLKREDFSIK